jgi:integrase
MVKEKKIGRTKIAYIPGSLGWAIEQFMASDQYAKRAESTKKIDKPILEFIKKEAGAGMLIDTGPKHVRRIRGMVKAKWKSATAKIAIGLFSTMWKFIDTEFDVENLPSNPTLGISRGHTSTKEHVPWPDEVLEAFERAAPPTLRLAFYLSLYTGQRRSDVAQMQWLQFDGKFIHGIVQQKTKARLSIPCHWKLREALDAQPDKTGFMIKTRFGTPYKSKALGQAFRIVLHKQLGIRGFSIHGLRSNAGVALADAGCIDREIMSILGHRTLAMVTKSTKQFNQRKLAMSAMEKLERAGGRS